MMDRTRLRENICCILLSLVLASMTTAGIFYNIAKQTRTIVDFLKETPNAFLILLAGFFILYFILIGRLFVWMDSYAGKTISKPEPGDRIRPSFKSWPLISAIVFICWIPYLIILFPGSMGGADYFWQLLQGCGALPLSNHHPVLGTLVFGMLYRTGYLMGGAEGGIFFTNLFQVILMSTIIGYIFSILKNMGVPRRIILVCLGVLCLCPVFPLNVIWAVKDSIFSSIAILFFFGAFVNIVGAKRDIGIPIIFSLPALTAMAVLFSLYRNGTTVIALMMLCFVAFVRIRNTGSEKKKSIIRGCAALMVFVILISGWGILMDQLKVYPTNFREACVTMSRQLLRSYDERPEKFNDEQIKTLKYAYRNANENWGGVEALASKRNYIKGDKFKPYFFKNNDEVKDYVKLWFEIGCRNPEIYLDEFLHSSYMYWWIGIKPDNVVSSTPLPRFKDFFEGKGYADAIIYDYFEPLRRSLGDDKELLQTKMSDYLKDYPKLREVMYLDNAFPKAITGAGTFTATIKKIPVLSLFMLPGFYAWIIMIAIAYLFSRKLEGRFMWPILLLTAIACLSPVNGYMRYVLPVDVFSLILVGICFIPGKTSKDSPNKDD